MSERIESGGPRFTRREWMLSAASTLGLGLAAGSLPLLLTACEEAAKRGAATDPQGRLLEQLAEAIIPRTETPGAIDTGTPAFVQSYFEICAKKEDRETFARGLAKIEAMAKTQHAASFVDLKPEAQTDLLHRLDRGEKPFTADDKAFFGLLKSAVLLGYYTSEAGATQELAFLPVPGGYRGNVPFASVGKAWAQP